jgi:tetratricopeptide (TPR) repeat protein
MLIVAGAFAGVGFLTMLLTSLFHFRAMNRLASIAATVSMGHGYSPDPAGYLSREEEHLLAAGGGSAAGQRLLQAIEKLEKRVIDLEHTGPLPATGSSMVEGSAVVSGMDARDDSGGENVNGAEAEGEGATDQMSMLLGKGQALMSLGQAEEALLCYDQALDLQPDSAETLVKKGSALEKLNRLDEAIECYDQAIATNQSMTLAYLYKGGLFNRMERYNEALACYEQALKTQQPSEALKQE